MKPNEKLDLWKNQKGRAKKRMEPVFEKFKDDVRV